MAKALVTDGLVTVEKRKEKRLQKLMEEYSRAQDAARKARVRPLGSMSVSGPLRN